MDKYQELYSYSISVFNEELNRFIRTESKASQYLAVLTFLIGVASYIFNWLISYVIPPKFWIDWALLVFAAAIFFYLLQSWHYNFSVLKVQDILKLPLDIETINFYNENRLIDIYYAMSKGIEKSLTKNRKVTDKKIAYLSQGYTSITRSAILLVIFTVFFFAKHWIYEGSTKIKKENIEMARDENSDKKQIEKPANAPKEEKPNQDVKPPNFLSVFESFIPIDRKKTDTDKRE